MVFRDHLVKRMLIVFCLLLLAPNGACAVDSKHVNVIILSGQSNAGGCGSTNGKYGVPKGSSEKVGLEFADTEPFNDVLFWSKATEYKSFGPLVANTGCKKKQSGPELQLGRKLVELMPEKKIAIVKYAVSGTALYPDDKSDWHPDSDELYTNLKTYVLAALDDLKKNGFTYEIGGMIWIHGESDAINSEDSANNYEKNLTTLVAACRKDFSAPDMPFVMPVLPTYMTGRVETIRAAQEKLNKKDKNVHLFTVDDLKRGYKYTGKQDGEGNEILKRDPYHYDEPSLDEIGRRAADVLKKCRDTEK